MKTSVLKENLEKASSLRDGGEGENTYERVEWEEGTSSHPSNASSSAPVVGKQGSKVNKWTLIGLAAISLGALLSYWLFLENQKDKAVRKRLY